MDNFISILRDSNSPEELENLKLQLFKENVKIKTEKYDLEDLHRNVETEKSELDKLKEEFELQKSEFEKIKEQYEKELAEINKGIEDKRKKLESDRIFLDKKQMVVESAYKQLDLDRQRLNREKEEFKKISQSYSFRRSVPTLEYRQGIFFKGITEEKALRKRYKDLIKVFHPDNFSGDNDTLQNINREYETLLHDININK